MGLYLGTVADLSRVILQLLCCWVLLAYCPTVVSAVVEAQPHWPLVEMEKSCTVSGERVLIFELSRSARLSLQLPTLTILPQEEWM